MTGPTYSEDGHWMWNGTEWVPAPPKEQVLPQSSIDEAVISNVASETGVDPERLTQVAPYFDQNQDQVLQQSELQQAALSIANVPNVPVPQQPAVPQQPVAPMAPAVAQPAAMPQQPVAPMAPAVPQQPAAPMVAPSSGKGKMIAAIGVIVALILASTVFYVWADGANLFDSDDSDASDNSEEDFQFSTRDPPYGVSNQSGDDLVWVKLTSGEIEYFDVVIVLTVDGMTTVQCEESKLSPLYCSWEHYDSDDTWSPSEEITITEVENLCDGKNNYNQEYDFWYCGVELQIIDDSADGKVIYQEYIYAQ